MLIYSLLIRIAKYASNLFEVEFYFLVQIKRIQRKMCACVFARITKSSFSKVFLITAKSSFSKMFWIKAVKGSKSTGDNHAKELISNVAAQLYRNGFSTWWSLVNLLHHYYKKNIKNTQERLLSNNVFYMIEYLFSRLLYL